LGTKDQERARAIASLVNARFQVLLSSPMRFEITDEELRRVFVAAVEEIRQLHDRNALEENMRPDSDHIDHRIMLDRAQAAALRIRARFGVHSRFNEHVEGELKKLGLEDYEFDLVRDCLDEFVDEPPEEDFRDYALSFLEELGVEATSANVALVTHQILRGAAAAQNRTDERYLTGLDFEGDDRLAEEVAKCRRLEPSVQIPAKASAPILCKQSAGPQTIVSGAKIESASQAFEENAEMPAQAITYATHVDSSSEGAPSLIRAIEDLAASECKAGKWTKKTARQHVALARLFAKMVGSDDPRQMRQKHLKDFRYLLDKLPKNYGKSIHDGTRSLSEILERTESLPADQIGMSPVTVDRYMTQLATIVKALKGSGYAIGDETTLSTFKANGESRPREAFLEDELRTLFHAPVFIGRDPADAAVKGEHIIHDAYYWTPLIAVYTGMRLSEIVAATLDEIVTDPLQPAIELTDTTTRELKTKTSVRLVPMHPELVRLGFLEYVAELRRRGDKLLFPDLRARGAKTSLASLFDKRWTKILDAALPNARQERKTLHSMRKCANEAIVNAREPDIVRKHILGHAPVGANEKSYVGKVEYETKLAVLVESLPNITAHLKTAPLLMWDHVPGARTRLKRQNRSGEVVVRRIRRRVQSQKRRKRLIAPTR